MSGILRFNEGKLCAAWAGDASSVHELYIWPHSMPMVFFPRGIYERSLFLGFCNRLDGTGQGPGAHIYKKRKGYGIEFVYSGAVRARTIVPNYFAFLSREP